MGKIIFNKEAWHERWLRGYESLALEYMPQEYGQGKVGAMFVSFDPDFDEDAPYHCGPVVDLPRGSAMLFNRMARFCRAHVEIMEDEIVGPGAAAYSRNPPHSMFYLSSILSAAFPYKADSSGFKIHAEIMAGYESEDLERDLGKEALICAAFFGLGVMLMDKFRVEFPLFSGAELAKKAEDSYIYIMEGI